MGWQGYFWAKQPPKGPRWAVIGRELAHHLGRSRPNLCRLSCTEMSKMSPTCSQISMGCFTPVADTSAPFLREPLRAHRTACPANVF